MLKLNSSLFELQGIGPSTFMKLGRKGIGSVSDMLFRFPTRYIDYGKAVPINRLSAFEKASIVAQVTGFSSIQGKRRNMTMQFINLRDSTGQISGIFFNQPYLRSIMKPGLMFFFSGSCKFFARKRVFQISEYHPIDITESNTQNEQIYTDTGPTPYYGYIKSMSQKMQRKIISNILKKIDLLQLHTPISDREYKKEFDNTTLQKAIFFLHIPKNNSQILSAKQRLAYEELFVFFLNIRRLYLKRKLSTAPCIKQAVKTSLEYFSLLPFKLTNDQKKALENVLSDLEKSTPTNRLIVGDVGSGKTAVALGAVYAVAKAGKKSLILVPTEILAQQHADTAFSIFKKEKISVGIMTNSNIGIITKKGIKKQTKKQLIDSPPDCIIATHSIIYSGSNISFDFVVVDEQHKFGVEQRSTLLKNKEKMPHMISLSATPIPRTLMMTLYGGMDVSLIKTKPMGRKRVKTIHALPSHRMRMYKWIGKQIKENSVQVFVVCPRITEDDDSNSSLPTVENIYKEYKARFPDLHISYIYGRHSQKQSVLDSFKNKRIDILVSTTVIEVGVDIPNATIMVVEGAENFGLAQLHQLRGRVGRRGQQSYCILIPSSDDADKHKRLSLLSHINDGFELAQKDLEMRGPGSILSIDQTGFPFQYAFDFWNTGFIEKVRMHASRVANKTKVTYNSPIISFKTDTLNKSFLH